MLKNHVTGKGLQCCAKWEKNILNCCLVWYQLWWVWVWVCVCVCVCVWDSANWRCKLDFVQGSSVQLLGHVWLFETPWIAICQASLSITNSQSSPKFMCESVMPSSHLILCRPLLLLPPIPPSISLFQLVNSLHEVAKVLEFQPHHQSFQWTPRTGLL